MTNLKKHELLAFLPYVVDNASVYDVSHLCRDETLISAKGGLSTRKSETTSNCATGIISLAGIIMASLSKPKSWRGGIGLQPILLLPLITTLSVFWHHQPVGVEVNSLPTKEMPKVAENLLFYDDDIVKRLDYWGPHTKLNSINSNVLQVVSHREVLIGCHSFTEYLSPKFHTVFVFPKRFVQALALDKLVAEVDSKQTAGLHLFITENWAGSHLARKIGEQFALEELKQRGWNVQFMNAVNCDVHQLPEGHRMFSSLEDVTLKLARDFEDAKLRQRNKQSLVINYNDKGYPIDENGACSHFCDSPIPHREMPILAMNSILFEDIPDMENLAKFHGRDTMKWWKQGGWANRPHHLGASPWLQDESNFFEDHMIMFDLDALRIIRDVYFAVAPLAFPDENNFLGVMANRNNMTVVRNNDVVLRLNFGHQHVPFPPTVDMELIKQLNFELLGEYRNPRFLSENWERASTMASVETDHLPFTTFVFMHCRKDVWLPSNWTDSTRIRDVLPVIDSYLSYCGYARLPTTHDDPVFRYALDGIHLPTRLVHHKKGRGWKLFETTDPPSLFLVDNVKKGPPERKNVKILEIQASATLSRSKFLGCKD